MRRLMTILALSAATLAAPAAFAGSHKQDKAQPPAPSCAAVTSDEIVALFDRWNASLATHSPDKVAANYAPNAVLLATVSNKPRMNPDEIKDYFHHFLEKDPKGQILTRTIKIGCNTAYDVGTYVFNVKGAQPGTRADVAARYSYIYEYINGKWLIVHHHSSAMPEPVK